MDILHFCVIMQAGVISVPGKTIAHSYIIYIMGACMHPPLGEPLSIKYIYLSLGHSYECYHQLQRLDKIPPPIHMCMHSDLRTKLRIPQNMTSSNKSIFILTTNFDRHSL